MNTMDSPTTPTTTPDSQFTYYPINQLGDDQDHPYTLEEAVEAFVEYTGAYLGGRPGKPRHYDFREYRRPTVADIPATVTEFSVARAIYDSLRSVFCINAKDVTAHVRSFDAAVNDTPTGQALQAAVNAFIAANYDLDGVQGIPTGRILVVDGQTGTHKFIYEGQDGPT